MSLVAILDADKEGFLRSAGSLIQTMGRAARNLNGRAILYADVHDRQHEAGDRRNQPPPHHAAGIQRGEQHHAAVDHQADRHEPGRDRRRRLLTVPLEPEDPAEEMTPEQRDKFIGELEEKMREAAKKFEFEQAAQLRDRIKMLKIS